MAIMPQMSTRPSYRESINSYGLNRAHKSVKMEKPPHFPLGIGQKVTRNELRYYEPVRAIMVNSKNR